MRTHSRVCTALGYSRVVSNRSIAAIRYRAEMDAVSVLVHTIKKAVRCCPP
jgi:hypothetical protein